MDTTDMLNYFGYGPMAYPEVMEALFGRTPETYASGKRYSHIHDWAMVTQTLNHVPNTYREYRCVTLNPRQHLEETWGPSFRSYTIVPRKGSVVIGVVWKISRAEREVIKAWELIHWGWFRELENVSIDTLGLVMACTECIGDGQEYDRDYPDYKFPLDYMLDENRSGERPPLLLPREKLLEVATHVGEEFRAWS